MTRPHSVHSRAVRRPPVEPRGVVLHGVVLRHLGRLAVRAASALALLVLAGGIPAGLCVYIGWPLPRHLPTSRAALEHLATTPITDTTVIDLLACALWILWAAFCYSLTLELTAARHGRPARARRLLSPIQALTALLVLGMTAGPLTLTAAPSSSTSPTAPPVAVVSVVPLPQPPATTVTLPQPPGSSSAASATTGAAAASARTDRSSGPAASDTADHVPRFAVATAQQTLTVAARGQHYTVTVHRGDTLWDIAGAWLHDPTRWPEIYRLNTDRYDLNGRMRGGDHIEPGWVLQLPNDAAPPSNAQPTPPPATATPPTTDPTSPPHDPSRSRPSAPAAPTPTTPTPTTPTPSTPAPATPAPSTAAPRPTASGSTPSAPHTAHRSPGITLPDGWIPAGLGAALLAAGAMVWLRRRHRYRPTPITSPVLDDPDLTPPLTTLPDIRRTLRRHAPAPTDHTRASSPTVREYTTAASKPPLPPVGPSGTDLAGIGGHAPSTGLGLIGPGALDAARALLVATLTSGHADDPDAQGHVVVPAATLASLLGVSAVDLGPMRRLTVASSFLDALTAVEEEIIRRNRVLADYDTVDVAALRATQGLAEPLPQLLLITDVPDDSWHARLSTAIRLGADVEITAVLVGDWPLGATLTVTADGTTNHHRTTTDGSTTDGATTDRGEEAGDIPEQRIAVLTTAATSDILSMLSEAHGDATSPEAAPPLADPDRPTPPTSDDALRSMMDTPVKEPRPPNPALHTPQPETPQRSEAPGAPVRVRVLGSPAVLRADGTPVPRGLRAKSLELAVYLAVHRRGASLDDIMEAVWGDEKPRRAAQHLSTCVANLRGVIRAIASPATTNDTPNASGPNTPEEGADDGRADDGCQERPALEPVVNTGSHYHLDPLLVTVDWWTVLDEYARVAAAPSDTARRTHLDRAITAIGGGLADGASYDWIDTDREYTRRYLIKIYAQAAELHVDDDPHQTHVYSDLACELDPLSDDLARRAMAAAARVGDAHAIHERRATLRRVLDDAGIDLSPATEQFAEDLLRDMANP